MLLDLTLEQALFARDHDLFDFSHNSFCLKNLEEQKKSGSSWPRRTSVSQLQNDKLEAPEKGTSRKRPFWLLRLLRLTGSRGFFPAIFS